MRVAIMQPYFCPYLGYFQLMHSADRFVLLDDVNFIVRGWINRNQILLEGRPHLFSLPVANASQNTRICDLQLSESIDWRSRLLKTVKQAYSRAPQFGAAAHFIESVIKFNDTRLVAYVANSVQLASTRLELRCEILRSSELALKPSLAGQHRIAALCKHLGATEYINPIGGRNLYDAKLFANAGIKLSFLEASITPYQQFGKTFVPGLSILDAMAFNTPEIIKARLLNFNLVQPTIAMDDGSCQS
ncbi:MAG: WbqC family protein [Burkholderiales bacterium]